MGSMDFFNREFDGNVTVGNQAYRTPVMPSQEVQSLHGWIEPTDFYARNKPFKTEAAPNIYLQQYTVPRQDLGVRGDVCDVVNWYAPGKPIDQGSYQKYTSNPLQARSIGSSLAYAGNAPYSGLYTGLVGYINQDE